MSVNSVNGVKILVVDNYDSFVYNLVQYLQQLGAKTTVVRNDEIKPEFAKEFDGVLISPGPGTPEAAGVSVELIKYCAKENIPLLGVCLGHQAIAVAIGAWFAPWQRALAGRKQLIGRLFPFTEINLNGWVHRRRPPASSIKSKMSGAPGWSR